MAILTNEPVQIIRGIKADIAQRTGSDGELNWATDSKELYIHDGKTRGGHLIGSAGGSTVITGGAGIAVSTVDGNSTISIKRDPSSVLYATTDGAGVRLGNSGGLQVTAQNALDLHLAEGGGLVVDSNGLKVDSSVLTSVFRYAGQVNSADDLPDDASIGDVYDVKDSGVNYVWTGSSWDNLGGILSVDPSPTQGSTNPVASGGVYDAIQAAKLSGDGKTVTVTSNTITAKDIAIGGDASDLASARGQIGNVVALVNPDFHTIIKSGMFWVSGYNQNNAPNDSSLNCFLISYANADSSYVMHIYMRTLNSNTCYLETYHTSNGWQPWRRVILDANIGDGITVNNGIISVPEYEGATASTPATSGLVPPAAKGEQDKVLRGDGEWGEYLPLTGGTMIGAINNCLAFGRGTTLTGSTIEVGSYNVFYKDITADTTFTMGAFPSGTSGIVFFTLILDEPGSHVITWPSNWQWGGDSTPPEMGRCAIINVVTSDNGATYFPTLAYNRD